MIPQPSPYHYLWASEPVGEYAYPLGRIQLPPRMEPSRLMRRWERRCESYLKTHEEPSFALFAGQSGVVSFKPLIIFKGLFLLQFNRRLNKFPILEQDQASSLVGASSDPSVTIVEFHN